MPDAATQRQARTPYERASDSYGRHIDTCSLCGTWHGPPLERCEAGDRLRKRMAVFWEHAAQDQQPADGDGRE